MCICICMYIYIYIYSGSGSAVAAQEIFKLRTLMLAENRKLQQDTNGSLSGGD